MQITDDDICRYQEMWREEFAEEISADGARKCMARVDALYLLLYRPKHRVRSPAFEERENANPE